jgi:hypothetical protein
MSTWTDIETSARALTDHDSDTQVTQPQLLVWANEEYPILVRRLAQAIPDRYRKIGPDFSGVASQDLAGVPVSLTDFDRLDVVQVKDGAQYYDLPLAPVASPESIGYLAFRQRGASTVDLYPSTLYAGRTFRAKYLYMPAVLTNASTIDVPRGAEIGLAHVLSERIRHRMEEDTSYLERAREDAWRRVIGALLPFYGRTSPETIVDVTGCYR